MEKRPDPEKRVNLKTEGANLTTSAKSSTQTSRCGYCGLDYKATVIYEDARVRYDPPFCSLACIDAVKKYRQAKYMSEVYPARMRRIIPPKYIDQSYISKDRAKRVNLGRTKSLYITGESGVGKTLLMVEILKDILQDAQSQVLWCSYPEFIVTLQSSFKDENFRADLFINEFAGFQGTLAIDDLGAEKMTEFVRQTTYYILNHREQYNLHTLITSNYSLAQIDEQIDSRISSRIAGECEIITLTGKDRRLEKRTACR